MKPNVLRWLVRIALVAVMLALLVYRWLVPPESRGPVGDYVLWGLVAVGIAAALYLLSQSLRR